MVVSGLPIVNKKQHADILATIALEIMDCIKCIKISHLPEKTIQIRLGIHSGVRRFRYLKQYLYIRIFMHYVISANLWLVHWIDMLIKPSIMDNDLIVTLNLEEHFVMNGFSFANQVHNI